MDTFHQFVLQLDQHLGQAAESLGPWVYVVVGLIIFAETGLVVMAFLPGDSLLLAVGALGGKGVLSSPIAALAIIFAAFAGNCSNYGIGRFVASRLDRSWWAAPDPLASRTRLGRVFRLILNPEHIRRANTFFEGRGGLAVCFARFVPFMRTMVPFVAGLSRMSWGRFVLFSAIGSILWVLPLVAVGHVFGNLPVVRDYTAAILFAFFTLIIIGAGVGLVLKTRAAYKQQPETARPATPAAGQDKQADQS
jgi:membrane-associated protein